MATRSFELTTIVSAPPAGVIDFLADLSAHRGMHPYLQSAQVVARGTAADGEWAEWAVVERPRLGPLRYTIRFPARMTRVSPDSLEGRVRAAPGCYLRTTTTARATDVGTVVGEVTEVEAPLPLVAYMARHARLAHERTFSMLNAELARRS
ncbi:hypothetical protein [Microbacterium rhizomatis]|uniref:SRPBCC family protein n=1 Tax=Microbacterium rhizomatis TaxID=1631477 RepID=A0A5J5IYY0_9MICO|nr:hypothetical protein [Microbacterium rhizomatis]KAA9105500.1 hypothetical protein F6B43_17130 [Microbacterium rhizomatis]